MDLGKVRDTLDSVNDTQGITDILLAVMYWAAVIVVILIVVYICFKISAYLKKKREGKSDEDEDDFLE